MNALNTTEHHLKMAEMANVMLCIFYHNFFLSAGSRVYLVNKNNTAPEGPKLLGGGVHKEVPHT